MYSYSVPPKQIPWMFFEAFLYAGRRGFTAGYLSVSVYPFNIHPCLSVPFTPCLSKPEAVTRAGRNTQEDFGMTSSPPVSSRFLLLLLVLHDISCTVYTVYTVHIF